MLDFDTVINNNQTLVEYERHLCVHNKLESYALNIPEAIALVYGNKEVTYYELNNLSNSLANKLIQSGVQTEDYIMVCLDRSIELMVSIYGILKAGGVYLPVLPEYPLERKKFIVSDSNLKFIITTKKIASTFETGMNFLFIEDFMLSDMHDYTTPYVDVKSTNLAYIIYTSGTTGNPKGVLIEHHSVMNRLGWMQKEYPIHMGDVLVQKTSISFDVSVWELFWWTFVGAKLLLLNQGEEKDPKQMLNQIMLHKVSVIHFVPSMLNVFISYLQSIEDKRALQSLKYIFCSGEALNLNTVQNLYKELKIANSNATIINLYGPTEATVDVTHYLCEKDENSVIPIGRPIDNTQIYIVNKLNEILPSNEKGELVICGVNLAREYLNRTELTNEKFIYINAFGQKTRAYKTGDIAYWNENCDLVYIGRNDNQIKLRGFRIELSEIECQLRAHPSVSDSSVIVQNLNENNATIIGFFVVKPGHNVSEVVIKNYLKRQLPDYMVPSILYAIDELPLSLNGKLDRKALFDLLENKNKEVNSASNTNYEKLLQEICSKLFKKPKIDPEINFFDLGGNSLMMVQLSLLIKKEFNKEIDVFIIMQNPTIRALAKYLSENNY